VIFYKLFKIGDRIVKEKVERKKKNEVVTVPLGVLKVIELPSP